MNMKGALIGLRASGPLIPARPPPATGGRRLARTRHAKAAATPGASGGRGGPAAMPAPGAYLWSWEDAPGASDAPSPFDAAHPLPQGALSAEAFGSLLQAAAGASEPPSRAWLAAACAAAAPALAALPPDAGCGALQQLAEVGYCPPGAWRRQLLAPLVAAAEGGSLTTRALADALWSLSSLSGLLLAPASSGGERSGGGEGCGVATEAARALTGALGRRLQDFYGPDLARAVCAAGTLATSGSGFDSHGAGGGGGGALAAQLGLDAAWMARVLEECEYQAVEFAADYDAFDLARLALGLALLSEAGSDGNGGVEGGGGGGGGGSGGAWPEAGPRLREALLKAVYARTRTIEEKAAVDYALARLDAKGKRSMHYDPRWTHEELKWLPRRERDKRRILKDGWYRTKWQGFRAGGE